ncbi:MAG: hypothetical protein A2383_01885 [Candidatus Pacebacteria bacterium RIFOXYB1_FULL_39_46]|nr:MAG: hypothetical protein A2182_03400 [Candidatus Pacebacteria bacterium RIFOXYA1_FULL_38_18]OGJ37919.1 MAG: hypothetical protein A2383_01885 [Candidatus Pacebacteria bacterium RIFOXYB1_FULL_39_46]OGJ39517.1 MAG: hypothetical protein A2411_02040 [Candidatus Pacebacteria bacterium RIFOXYC1_FULL_39_21]OGJ40098.1 MAG: hypothetical protein A2582_03330 [Candidatus Pacebacteria bacterium RIFOXYD1_FULL_39_27]
MFSKKPKWVRALAWCITLQVIFAWAIITREMIRDHTYSGKEEVVVKIYRGYNIDIYVETPVAIEATSLDFFLLERGGEYLYGIPYSPLEFGEHKYFSLTGEISSGEWEVSGDEEISLRLVSEEEENEKGIEVRIYPREPVIFSIIFFNALFSLAVWALMMAPIWIFFN